MRWGEVKTYTVDDISRFSQDVITVEANSPLEAVKKAYPDCEVSRDYDNTGNIVVGGHFETRYGRGYRQYVYKLIKRRLSGEHREDEHGKRNKMR